MAKKLRKLYKSAVSLRDACIGVGSLTPTKDAMEKIVKIIEQLQARKEQK